MDEILIEVTEITHRVHLNVDSKMNSLNKVCKRGCNSCCHQIVDTASWEELRIQKFIDEKLGQKTKRQITKNLKKWFSVFNRVTRDADHSSPLTRHEINEAQRIFREKKIPCPFLVNSECSIYEVRPLVCKTHYVESSPELCKQNPHRNTTQQGMDVYNYAAAQFDPNIYPLLSKPLAYLVALQFGLTIKSKPMIGIVFGPK